MLKLLLATMLVVSTAYPVKLDNKSDSTVNKYISALGDADTARAVSHSVCSYRDNVLSDTEIDALNATPIELVPAPGAGYTNILCGVTAWLNYGGTAWAGSSETIPIKYGTAGTTATTVTEAFMESTADKIGLFNAVDVVAVENASLYATASADFTTGNSPLSLRVYYRTVGASLIQE